MKEKKVKTKRLKDHSSFKSFWFTTILQIMDKLKFSFRKPDGKVDVKSIIQKIVFTILKFVLVGGGVGAIIFIAFFLKLFELIHFMDMFILFYSILMILNLISNTFKLMKDLYYSDDNKVLVTLPVTSSQLFFSKLIVFIVQDLTKAFDILIPVTLGFGIVAIIGGVIPLASLFWCWIPLLLANLILVLIAAFASIPSLYVYKFFKTYPLFELIALIALVIGGIVGYIFLVQLIPSDINLVMTWSIVRDNVLETVGALNVYNPFAFVVHSMYGYATSKAHYVLEWRSFITVLVMIGLIGIIGGIAYLVIKPFYFNMMTKTFEFDKNVVGISKKNHPHKRFITFTNKDFKLNFRDIEISGSYLVVYIVTPLSIFFIDKVFSAFLTAHSGDIMIYAFNLLLITLPFLASNSMVATMFSKEGRAAYIKKTKPINVFMPLTSKLLFNLLFSLPSIIACAVIFGIFSDIGWFPPVAMAISVILVQYGHIFFSSMKDLMNPQNEVYATNGEFNSNPNERLVTAVAFIISFALFGLFWFFLTEADREFKNLTPAFIRLIIVSAGIFASFLTLYILNVKAYYYEK